MTVRMFLAGVFRKYILFYYRMQKKLKLFSAQLRMLDYYLLKDSY